MEQKSGIESSDRCHWEGEASKGKGGSRSDGSRFFLWKHSTGCEGFSFSIPGVIPEGEKKKKITSNVLKCFWNSRLRAGMAMVESEGKSELIPGFQPLPKVGTQLLLSCTPPSATFPAKSFFLAFFPHHPPPPRFPREFPSLPGIPNSSRGAKKEEEP